MANVPSSLHTVATHLMGLNTPTVMSLYATNSVILEKCNEGSNKFLLVLSVTLSRGFPVGDLRRSYTVMGCLTGKGDGIQCSHPQRFHGPHGRHRDDVSPTGEQGATWNESG